MGHISDGGLAGAVSEAGGLGVIGGGYADVAWIEREARDQHELTVYSGS
jgi:nitronate monooxygenase